MIRKFHQWLIDNFLPRYAHQALLEELAKTKEALEKTRAALREEKAYSEGLEYALRHGDRILITTQGANDHAKPGE